MQLFFQIIGAISFFMLCLAMLGVALLEWKERTIRQVNKTRDDIRKLAVKEIGEDIENQSFWFSEDKSAQNLARCIGANLRTGSYDVEYTRSRWREYTKTQE